MGDIKYTLKIHVPDNRVYWGGDIIYGVVEMMIEDELKSAGLLLEFEAFEKVQYLQEPSLKFRYERRSFIHHSVPLSGNPLSKEFTITPLGRFFYPFAFQLPPLVVPSVTQEELRDCYIQYNITAFLVTPPGGERLFCFQNIHVGGSLHDQFHFSQLKPITRDNITKFVLSGKMKMTVSLGSENCFTGEPIYINLNVENSSGKSVQAVKVELQTSAKYESVFEDGTSRKNKKKKFCLAGFKYDVEVPEKTDKKFHLSFDIPNIVPTLDQKSEVSTEILTVKHKLHVRLDVPMATDPIVKIPITIQRENKLQQRVQVSTTAEKAEKGKPTCINFNVPANLAQIDFGSRSMTIFPEVPNYVFPTEIIPTPLSLGKDLNPEGKFETYSTLLKLN